MVGVGAMATDWANDGLFGDGYHLFGIGTAAYEEAAEEYGDTAAILEALEAGESTYVVEDEETLELSDPIEITDEAAEEARAMAENTAKKALILQITESGFLVFLFLLETFWKKSAVQNGFHVLFLTVLLQDVVQFLALFLRCSFSSFCSPSLKPAVTWRELPLFLTASSVSSDFLENHSFLCLLELDVAYLVLWQAVQSKTNATAV